MKITLLCSDDQHPVNTWLDKWIEINNDKHDITLARKKEDLPGGDILFLISCGEIIQLKHRASYRFSLVLHASDLPRGRGWSPHIWEILAGAREITVCLLEAEDKVDSGKIWGKITIQIPNHALWDEINQHLFKAEIALIDMAVTELNTITPIEQNTSIEPTYHRLRLPSDSQIDPDKSIADQFNQIRVCDPQRYPAFFELHGHRYQVKLEKIS